jgi:phosphatidylglycerophosphate synthase
MASYAEKWQSALTWRPALPRILFVEAGLELAAQGGIVATFSALGFVPLSWRGLSVAALSYALVTLIVVFGLSLHAPHRHFGIANAVTLLRAGFNALLLAVAGEVLLGGTFALNDPTRWWLTGAAATALALDGVDGWAARRSRMASAFGARFDMETDALFILGLALLLAAAGIVGPWVLASGLTYYLFRVAAWMWPWLNSPLFPSLRRKTVCVAQVAFLILALVPALPIWGARLSCMTGLVLLIYSFAVDIIWLYARARSNGTLHISSA